MNLSFIDVLQLKKENKTHITYKNNTIRYFYRKNANTWQISFYSEMLFSDEDKNVIMQYNCQLKNNIEKEYKMKKLLQNKEINFILSFFKTKDGWVTDSIIEDLNLTMRTYNTLKRNNILTLRKLLSLKKEEIDHLRFVNDKVKSELIFFISKFIKE